MKVYKKIGIIVADIDEYKPFLNTISEYNAEPINLLGKNGHSFNLENSQITAVNCGIGKVNAAASTAALILSGCEIIINFGLSGGISGVMRGDFVLGTSFFEHDFDLTPLGYKKCVKPGGESVFYAQKSIIDAFLTVLPDVKSGAFATGDCFVCDDMLRRGLKDDFGAVACDMETAAIAGICSENGVPFLSLRSISDDAGNDAASSYRQANENQDMTLSGAVFEFIKLIVKE